MYEYMNAEHLREGPWQFKSRRLATVAVLVFYSLKAA